MAEVDDKGAIQERATISAAVQDEVNGTQYACTEFKPLTGGTANFIFHGLLSKPLEDGTLEVAVKHGEGYVASYPDFKLATSRCQFEVDALAALSTLAPVLDPSCIVRTPRLFHFNPETNTQIQEYLPNSVNLKVYALSHFTSNDESLKSHCLAIGKGLGLWLRSFHAWASDPAQSKLQSQIKLNEPMQALKNSINYANLVSRINKFPTILEDAREVFEAVKKDSEAELTDESQLQIIHGDFWTGNALLPDAPLQEGSPPTIFIIDWELCHFGVKPLDLGQMIAELYELYHFKGIRAGLWLIDGFCAGYQLDNDDFAFRTAIHVGTHLIGFGSSVPDWGSEEQVLDVVAKGKEFIVRAYRKDRAWFLESDLACLFR